MKPLLIALVVGIPIVGGGIYFSSGGSCPFSCHSRHKSESTESIAADCKDGRCCEAPTRGEAFVSFVGAGAVPGPSDSPMYGGSPSRNMANFIDKNVPIDFSTEEGKEKKVKWTAVLGNKAYGGPVISCGRVYVGTNNANPRDPKDLVDNPKKKKKGGADNTESVAVLMCFDEKDGKFLWQIKHDCPPDELFNDARRMGLCSTPTVDSGHVYYVTPGCVVVCADTEGKITWQVDMMKELNVTPYHLGNCSPLVFGDHVFVVTGNGIDEMTGKVRDPRAPSFAAFDKKTGKLAWKSDLPGDRVVEGQWSNPVHAAVGGKPQVIFPGGDSVLYSFEPATGKLIWKFDCQPGMKRTEEEIKNYFISTPVVVGDRLYVGLGFYPGGHPHPTKSSHVVCVDITKTGDVSPKNLDAKDAANKGSALVWAYGGEVIPRPKNSRRTYFERTISTCSVADGLVYVAEEAGYIHCLDAGTGKHYWEHDLTESIWGSTYWVDGKVYLLTESGSLNIYVAGKEKKLAIPEPLTMEPQTQSTPVVANGVLYVLSNSKLYAIAAPNAEKK